MTVYSATNVNSLDFQTHMLGILSGRQLSDQLAVYFPALTAAHLGLQSFQPPCVIIQAVYLLLQHSFQLPQLLHSMCCASIFAFLLLCGLQSCLPLSLCCQNTGLLLLQLTPPLLYELLGLIHQPSVIVNMLVAVPLYTPTRKVGLSGMICCTASPQVILLDLSRGSRWMLKLRCQATSGC